MGENVAQFGSMAWMLVFITKELDNENVAAETFFQILQAARGQVLISSFCYLSFAVDMVVLKMKLVTPVNPGSTVKVKVRGIIWPVSRICLE